MRFAFVVHPCFVILSLVAGLSSGAPAQERTVAIRVALVLDDATIRPIPLHALEVRVSSDAARADTIRTGLDGLAQWTPRGSVGVALVRSLQPVAIQGKTYQWIVTRDAALSVEWVLTNDNATIAGVTTAAARIGPPPERALFQRARASVFRVEAGLAHGTGFLIDSTAGIVLTNAHVIGTSDEISVTLDSATRVPAVVLARDRQADIAVLGVPAVYAARRPSLTMRKATPLADVGDRVIAIGFPLSQEITMTTGIVSGVRETAIISDVAINPGNSGGPMLSLEGEVVGINTFGEGGQTVGPGIAGAVRIDRAFALVAAARNRLAQGGNDAMAPEVTLPVMPRTVISEALLDSIVSELPDDRYDIYFNRRAGPFTVMFMTPPALRVSSRVLLRESTRERRAREAEANVGKEQRYDAGRSNFEWERYVGAPTTAVLTVEIVPQIGETFGSALARGLQAGLSGRVTSKGTFKFQGDVRGARFYRNGVEVIPYRGGHGPQLVREENGYAELKDVADRGYFVLPYMLFEPDSSGAPPTVTIVVQDLKNPESLARLDIRGNMSADIWNDYVRYHESVVPRGTRVVRANPEADSPDVDLVCSPVTGRCELAGR